MTIYEFYEPYQEVFKINEIRFAHDDPAGLNEEDSRKYNLIKKLLSLHEEYRNQNTVFQPGKIWQGKRTFDLADLTDDDYNLLYSIELTKLPVVVRARIQDVLWVTRKDFYSAQKAVESYIYLFDLTYDNSAWTCCADMICRALCISAQLGRNNDYYTKVCERIKEALVQEDGKDPLFLSIVLLEKLIKQRYGLYSDYIGIADKIIKHSIENGQNWNKVEEAFQVKRQLLVWGKQKTHDCDMDLVSYYETIADEKFRTINDLFISIEFLKKAIHLARDCKEREKATELLRKLEAVQKKIPGRMQKFSHTVDMTELHDNIVKLFNGTSFAEDLLTVTRLVHIYSREELRKQVEEQRGHFISFMGTSLMDDQGHTIIDLPPLDGHMTDERVVELHMFRKLQELTGIVGKTSLLWAIQEINKKHTFDENDLKFIFDECAVVRSNRSKILAVGMNFALHGKFYEALHILAPQAENLFRYIAEENGGLVYTLDDDDTSNAKTLSSIFDIPELVDCYDPDYLFTFRGLLNEKAGSNIRNLVAHGLLEPEVACSGTSIYLCMALLKICVNTSRGFFRRIDEINR